MSCWGFHGIYGWNETGDLHCCLAPVGIPRTWHFLWFSLGFEFGGMSTRSVMILDANGMQQQRSMINMTGRRIDSCYSCTCTYSSFIQHHPTLIVLFDDIWCTPLPLIDSVWLTRLTTATWSRSLIKWHMKRSTSRLRVLALKTWPSSLGVEDHHFV